jgi:hypothetical protein
MVLHAGNLRRPRPPRLPHRDCLVALALWAACGWRSALRFGCAAYLPGSVLVGREGLDKIIGVNHLGENRMAARDRRQRVRVVKSARSSTFSTWSKGGAGTRVVRMVLHAGNLRRWRSALRCGCADYFQSSPGTRSRDRGEEWVDLAGLLRVETRAPSSRHGGLGAAPAFRFGDVKEQRITRRGFRPAGNLAASHP